jgi:hypothetical protein
VDWNREIETPQPSRRLTRCAANMHPAVQRAFIVREYWRTGSFKPCTSQETHCLIITKASRIRLFRETVGVCCENYTKHTYTLCGQHA